MYSFTRNGQRSIQSLGKGCGTQSHTDALSHKGRLTALQLQEQDSSEHRMLLGFRHGNGTKGMLGRICCFRKGLQLALYFPVLLPTYTELWPPLSSASVYVTPQYWKLPLSLTPSPRSELTDCTFSDCKAPSGMGSGFGSRHSVGLAGSGEPWHLESRLDSHGYRFSVPLLRLAAMSHKA